MAPSSVGAQPTLQVLGDFFSFEKNPSYNETYIHFDKCIFLQDLGKFKKDDQVWSIALDFEEGELYVAEDDAITFPDPDNKDEFMIDPECYTCIPMPAEIVEMQEFIEETFHY
jgi:hypothetical protein